MVKALKATWVLRLLNSTDKNWNIVPNVCFKLKINDFLTCAFDKSDIPGNLPAFYKEVLHSWLHVTQHDEELSYIEIAKQSIWFNRHITIGTKTLF